jgi:hypothetical protein
MITSSITSSNKKLLNSFINYRTVRKQGSHIKSGDLVFSKNGMFLTKYEQPALYDGKEQEII